MRIMSGSGGGSYSGSGSTGEACELLNARTHLDSPNPEAVQSIKEGDVLNIRLKRIDGTPVRYSLEVLTSEGVVAGTVNPPNLPRFIECINEGFNYVARVQSKQGGLVRVEIRTPVS